MEQGAARVRSELLPDISPERPFVLVVEIFQKGGYKTSPFNCVGNYIATYPERVISKLVITPGHDGLVTSVTEDIRAIDGTPPVVRSLVDDSIITGPLEDPCPPEEYTQPEGRWDVVPWVDAQLDAAAHAEELGHTFAGRSSLNGRPSFSYERRTPASLSVLEFVEAEPLLSQESHYTVQDDGSLILESQTTVVSASAGE
ncbi:MAG: hypothetical protein OXE50_00565 [Chloroflexi bacterium]|nr:hypothetical protein [Chloroflexota bacterium]